jgi:hypothetical protein
MKLRYEMERKREQSSKRHEEIGNILVKDGGRLGREIKKKKIGVKKKTKEGERKYFREKFMWKITAGTMQRDTVAM